MVNPLLLAAMVEKDLSLAALGIVQEPSVLTPKQVPLPVALGTIQVPLLSRTAWCALPC